MELTECNTEEKINAVLLQSLSALERWKCDEVFKLMISKEVENAEKCNTNVSVPMLMMMAFGYGRITRSDELIEEFGNA